MVGETARRLACALLIACASACSCDAPVVQDAGPDASSGCRSDAAQCDDGIFCNGVEHCAPDDEEADARGCVVVPACMASEDCDEETRACGPRDGGTADAGPDGGDCDRDRDGHDAMGACGGDDCDDDDRYRYPGNAERCDDTLPDGRPMADHDEDCVPCTVTGFMPDGDEDDDTFLSSGCTNPWLGDAEPTGCDPSAVRVLADERIVAGADCDDESGNVRPNQVEVCGNAVDDNCDGAVDDGRFFRDNDNDGRGDPDIEMTGSCMPGWVSNAEDCDDVRIETYLGAPERCDGLDNDCSLAGEMAGGPDPSEDMDGDGHSALDAACLGLGEAGAPTTAMPKDDCDDARAIAHPGADERCDAPGDEDCDGMTDESGAADARDWYVDGDGDTYGAGTPIRACTAPGGRVDRAGDCNDASVLFHPGAAFQALPDCGGLTVCGSPPYFCARTGPSGPCTELIFPTPEPNWDYDCNGTDDPEYFVLPVALRSCSYPACTGFGSLVEAPVCGATQSMSECEVVEPLGCQRVPTYEVLVRCR